MQGSGSEASLCRTRMLKTHGRWVSGTHLGEKGSQFPG